MNPFETFVDLSAFCRQNIYEFIFINFHENNLLVFSS